MKKMRRLFALLTVAALLCAALTLAVGANTDGAGAEYLDEVPEDLSFTATSELAAASGSYVVYESELDFYRDLENGVIDGLADGESVISTKTFTDFPTSGYVCMLKNFTLQPKTVGSPVSIPAGGSLKINLGGHTFTEKGCAGKSGNTDGCTPISVGAGATLGFYNGSLVDSLSSKFTTNLMAAGARLELRDINLTARMTWENWSSTFQFNGAGSVLMDNCKVTQGTQVTVFYMNGNSTLDFDIRGLDYTDNGTHTLYNKNTGAVQNNGAFYGMISTSRAGATLNLNVDGDTVVRSGNLVNCSVSGATVNLNAEVGFTMARESFVNDYIQHSAFQNFSSVDRLSVIVDGVVDSESNATFVSSGGLYVLKIIDATIYWYDEHGVLLFEQSAVSGEIPAYDYALPAFGVFGDAAYKLTAGGWALSADGDVLDELSPVMKSEGERKYYYVPEKTALAVAVFSDDTCRSIVGGWVDRQITRELLATIPAGAYVKLFGDIGVNPGLTDAAATVMDNYATGIVFDLSGYTMVHLKEGESAKRWAPLDGKTITFKNGKMQVIGEDSLICSEASGGSIRLYDVLLVSDAKTAPILELRSGRVELYGGSIFSLGTTPISCNAYSSSSSATLTLGLHGVDIDAADNPLMTVSVAQKADRAAAVDVTVGAYDDVPTTLRSGSFISFGDMTALSRATTVTVSVRDTYALLTGEALVGADGAIATWYDAVTGNSAADTATEARNIRLSFDNYYTNRRLTQIGSASLECGVTITAEGMGRYTVIYSAPKLEGPMASLTLESDFDLNLYVPQSSNVVKIMIGDAVLFDRNDPTTYELSEGVYRFAISGISPENAASYIALDITYVDEIVVPEVGKAELDFTVRAYYSVINYAEDLLESADGTTEAKNAMRALLAYVRAAYDNFEGSGSPELLSRLDSLYTEYGAGAYVDSLAGDIRGDDSDFGAESGITAQFAIGSVTKLYISFPESVDYVITDAESGVTVAIGTGRACTVELPAYLLAETLEITVGDKSAIFSFGEYADALMNDGTENASEDAVLRAMYAYGRAAKALRAAKA
ncbi:MAG: hypothetical protein IKA64_05340 [Clostridia bacterium]|nr:hypothetical protein [Clostridia bacterium]